MYWPNNIKGFEHVTEAKGKAPLGYYSSYSLCTPEHGGTHLDAPIHFSENKLTVDRIPLSSLTARISRYTLLFTSSFLSKMRIKFGLFKLRSFLLYQGFLDFTIIQKVYFLSGQPGKDVDGSL